MSTSNLGRTPKSYTNFPPQSLLSNLTNESSSPSAALESCEQLIQYATCLNNCSAHNIATHHDESSYHAPIYSSDKLSKDCNKAISSLSTCMKDHNDGNVRIISCKCLIKFIKLIYGLLYNYNSLFPNIESEVVPESIRTLEDDICINIISKLCMVCIVEEDDHVASNCYKSLHELIFTNYQNALQLEIHKFRKKKNEVKVMDMEFLYKTLYNTIAPRYLRQLFQRMMLMKSHHRYISSRLILSCIQHCIQTSDNTKSYDLDYRSMLQEILQHWILPDMMNGMQRLEYKKQCALISLEILVMMGVDAWNYDVCVLSSGILSLSLDNMEMSAVACLSISLRGLLVHLCGWEYWKDRVLLVIQGLDYTPYLFRIGVLADLYLLLFRNTTLDNLSFMESILEEMISGDFEIDAIMTLCTSSYLFLHSTCNTSSSSSSPTRLELQSTIIWIRLSILILKHSSSCLAQNNTALESYFILLLTTVSLLGYTSNNSFSFQLITQMTSSLQYTTLHRCKDIFVETLTHHQQQLQQQLHDRTTLSSFMNALMDEKSKHDLFLLLSHIIGYFNEHRFVDGVFRIRIGILAILAEYWIIHKKVTDMDDYEINARDILSLLENEISIVLQHDNQEYMDLLLICIYSIEKMALSSLERQLQQDEKDECTYIVSVSIAALSGHNAASSDVQKSMQQECSKAVARIQYMVQNRKKISTLSPTLSKSYYNNTKTIHVDYTPYLKSSDSIPENDDWLLDQTSFFHVQYLMQHSSRCNFHSYVCNSTHKYAQLHSDYPLHIPPFRAVSYSSIGSHFHEVCYSLLGSSDPLQVSMGFSRQYDHLYVLVKIYNTTPVSIPNGLRADLNCLYVPIPSSIDDNSQENADDDCHLYQSLYNHEIEPYQCVNWSFSLSHYDPPSWKSCILQRQIQLRITLPKMQCEPSSHTCTWAECPLPPTIINTPEFESDLSSEYFNDDEIDSYDDGDNDTTSITLPCEAVPIPNIIMLSPCLIIFQNKKPDEILFCSLWKSFSHKITLSLVKQNQQSKNSIPLFIEKAKFKFSKQNDDDIETWAFQSWKNKRLFCSLSQEQNNSFLEIRSDDEYILSHFVGDVHCQKSFIHHLFLDDYILCK